MLIGALQSEVLSTSHTSLYSDNIQIPQRYVSTFSMYKVVTPRHGPFSPPTWNQAHLHWVLSVVGVLRDAGSMQTMHSIQSFSISLLIYFYSLTDSDTYWPMVYFWFPCTDHIKLTLYLGTRD